MDSATRKQERDLKKRQDALDKQERELKRKQELFAKRAKKDLDERSAELEKKYKRAEKEADKRASQRAKALEQREHKAREAERAAEAASKRAADTKAKSSDDKERDKHEGNRRLLNEVKQASHDQVSMGEGSIGESSARATESGVALGNVLEDQDDDIRDLTDFDDTEVEEVAVPWWEKALEYVKDNMVKVGVVVGVVLIVFATYSFWIFSMGKNSAPAPKAQVQKAQSIEGAYELLDSVESMKDAQIRTLRQQLEEQNAGSGTSRITADEVGGLALMNADALTTLDPFFTTVLGIKPTASASELATHQKTLAEYFTPGASTSELYTFLSGRSPAKDVGEKVAKYGTVWPLWSGVSNETGVRTYVVAVPFATESRSTAKAIYSVSLTESKKIVALAYHGVLNDGKATPLEEGVAKSPSDDSLGALAPQENNPAPAPEGEGAPPAEGAPAPAPAPEPAPADIPAGMQEGTTAGKGDVPAPEMGAEGQPVIQGSGDPAADALLGNVFDIES